MHFLSRESFFFIVSILAGILLSLLLFYPDTKILIGFRNAQDQRKSVPTILLDFDTPTVDQMGQFKSVEEFEEWVIAFASSQLVKEGIVKAGTPLLLVRVSDLPGSSPERLLTYTASWSGLRRLLGHLWPPQRGFIVESWGTVLLPYPLLLVLRILLFAWKARLHPDKKGPDTGGHTHASGS